MEMYGMTGERLGIIGTVPPEGLPWRLPKWKEDFLAKPSVSMRRGIAWGYDPPFEDTDTLVLTAPSGKYVDIRFPKDAGTPEEASNHLSFWAFSGEVTTTFHDISVRDYAVDMPYTAHCKFSHDIDSRGNPISDEGDMFLLMNGDCLEMGIMENPANGTNQLYKEYWHSADKLPIPDGENDESICIVAHAVGPASVQGILIRSGGRVQGITLRKESDKVRTIEVERWIRDRNVPLSRPINTDNGSIPPGPWSRDVRSSGFLPGGWLCLPGRHVGERLEFNGITWKIGEVH